MRHFFQPQSPALYLSGLCNLDQSTFHFLCRISGYMKNHSGIHRSAWRQFSSYRILCRGLLARSSSMDPISYFRISFSVGIDQLAFSFLGLAVTTSYLISNSVLFILFFDSFDFILDPLPGSHTCSSNLVPYDHIAFMKCVEVYIYHSIW